MSKKNMISDEILIVGKINGFYGLKGYLKLFSETRPRKSILQYKTFLIRKNGGDWSPISVVDAKELSKNIVIQFEGFTDRTSVEHLLGSELAIYLSQLPTAKKDEYYWRDLVGLTVINTKNEHLGVVDSLMETGANDVLVLKNREAQELLIPFTLNHAIISVDIKQKIIIADWDADDL